MKTKASPYEETLGLSKTIPYYSDNYPLCEFDWIRLRLVALTPPKENEPQLIKRDRARIESAIMAKDHLQQSGFPPILNSFDYECLALMGVA